MSTRATGAIRTSSSLEGEDERVAGMEGEGEGDGIGVPRNRRRIRDMMRERS